MANKTDSSELSTNLVSNTSVPDSLRRHRSQSSPDVSPPPAKRLRQDAENAWVATQNQMESPVVETSTPDSADTRPDHSYYAASSPQNSPPRGRGIPPAPPSTPASVMDTQAKFPDVAFPVIVENATALEKAQLMDGAPTPAPPRKLPPSSEDFSEWAVGPRYELIRILGRGSYGEVAKARDLVATQPDTFVAIKRITSAFDQEVDAVRIYREMHILRRLRGNHCIIQLLDVVQPPTDDLDDFNDLYLVFEYVDTDLYKLIMSPQYLTTEHIQTFLYQMLTGLKYIHSASVIHRDLKPANILLNEDCSLKICDFGLARIVDPSNMISSGDYDRNESTTGSADEKKEASVMPRPTQGLTRQLTKHVVTRWYRAPELILIQPYTSAVDIWSLGCILAELLSMQEGSVRDYQQRVPLFPGGSCYPLSGEGASIGNDERLDQLSVIFGVIGTPDDAESIGTANEYIRTFGKKKGRTLESLYPAADPAAIDLLKKMLKFEPRHRCTVDEALEHDFLKDVRRREMEQQADKPLIGPEFLETNSVDLATLKTRTFEEVLWYRDNPTQTSLATVANGDL